MRSQEGAAAAEYALLLAMVGVAVTIALIRLSGAVSDSIGANATAVAMADAGPAPKAAKSLASAGATAVSSVPSDDRDHPPAEDPASRHEPGHVADGVG